MNGRWGYFVVLRLLLAVWSSPLLSPPPLPLQRALSCALAALAPICARAFLLTARSCVQVRAALLPRAKEYGAKMDGCV